MIIPVTPFHAPALAEIHRCAFPPAEMWSEAALAAQLRAPGGYGFVAEAGGFILARVIVEEAEVLTLAVLPDLRRRGIATALLAAAVAEAARRGADRMLLEVSDRNEAARALYAAAGFAAVGLRRAYYADGADALILRHDFRNT